MALIRFSSGGCSYSWMRHKDRNCKSSAKAEDERKTSGEGAEVENMGGWVGSDFRAPLSFEGARGRRKNVNIFYRHFGSQIWGTWRENFGGEWLKNSRKFFSQIGISLLVLS